MKGNVLVYSTIIKLCTGVFLLLDGCRREEEYRTPRPFEIVGSWTASGPSYESGGLPPTSAQLANFKGLEAGTYTFHADQTYSKRSTDSVVSANTILVKLEKGNYRLSGDTLILTTTNNPRQTPLNTYYNCYLKTGNDDPLSLQTLRIRTTKELLLKSLDEQVQADPLVQQNRAFLNARDMFKINQTLQR
ncbi:hypothetical protein [Larkinella terrae]|uniref:Uncharacterized protein n=1 Tax=Larkinella terrae TaxID=2025311 RepID=A0A7K0EJA3_9BACT|nr:hypothetical protein [Larkinella terrae]MRS61528.1 hypothetical protein [Larkinella terrae]